MSMSIKRRWSSLSSYLQLSKTCKLLLLWVLSFMWEAYLHWEDYLLPHGTFLALKCRRVDGKHDSGKPQTQFKQLHRDPQLHHCDSDGENKLPIQGLVSYQHYLYKPGWHFIICAKSTVGNGHWCPNQWVFHIERGQLFLILRFISAKLCFTPISGSAWSILPSTAEGLEG